MLGKRKKKNNRDVMQMPLRTRAKTIEIDKLGKSLNFSAAEAYKLLRANLFLSFSAEDEGAKIIGVTSAEMKEGKSLTSLNLALSIAETGRKVILLDGDLRLPSIAKKLGKIGEVGLSELITDLKYSIPEVIQKNAYENVDIIFSGNIPPNPAELIGSNRMQHVLRELASVYDYVILDLPPVNQVADPIVAAPYLSGVVLVVRSEYAEQASVEEAVRKLRFANVKLLGFVYNGDNTKIKQYKKGKGYYKGYYSGYYKKPKSAGDKQEKLNG